MSGTPAGIVCIELPAAQGEGETLSTGQQSSLTVSAVYTKLQVSWAALSMCFRSIVRIVLPTAHQQTITLVYVPLSADDKTINDDIISCFVCRSLSRRLSHKRTRSG